jgi:Kef-type K+ transport system membrane component KefB
VGEPTFTSLLVVVAVAFAAPLLLGLFPGVRLPAVVLELVTGIAIGPSGLGWVEVDATIEVLAFIGLAFLLFLAGLEIDFRRLRGRVLRLAATGYALSFALAVGLSIALSGAGLVDTPLFVAILLSATSLGVIISVLKDAGRISSTFGQLVIAAGAVVFLAVRGGEHSMRIREDLLRLQDSTAQIRVRGAVVLLVAFAAVAEALGLEVILGAFAAGALLSLLDRDEMMTHAAFRTKLEAIGFGVFIPVFFITSGLRFDLAALFASGSTIAMVPVFLAVLLVVRGLPALVLYRGVVSDRQAAVAGLFQATSLPFIVAGTAIGLELGLIDAAGSAALVASGLLSVVIFPALGLGLLRSGDTGRRMGEDHARDLRRADPRRAQAG